MYSHAIILGVLISLLFTELTGYSAGLVLPGYLALCLHTPLRILSTLLISLIAVGLCRLLARVTILYGRRRFAVLILIPILISWLPGVSGLLPGGAEMIGYVVPGIAAREMDRQGVGVTLLSMAATGGMVALLLTLFGYPVGW